MNRVHFSFTSLLLLAVQALSAQSYFTTVAPEAATFRADKATKQQEVLITDLPALSAALAAAPLEFTPAARTKATTLSFPLHDGTSEDFAVWRVMTCEQAVYDKYPEIRTFAGRSLKDPKRTLRGSITMRGLRVFVYDANYRVTYIQPMVDSDHYRVYRPDDFPQAKPFGINKGQGCGTDHTSLEKTLEASQSHLPGIVEDRGPMLGEEAVLRTYRFVVSNTSTFVADHGGTKASAFAATVEYVNALNVPYERDARVRLQLQASSENVIFLEPTPLFPDNQPADVYMVNNTLVVNSIVKSENYDVGHVLSRTPPSTGLYGIANLNSVCGGNKGAGSSSGSLDGAPDYGLFFINTFSHEVGHQYSATHTWNHCGGNEGGRSSESAWEPGGGSTIMAYAGICGSDNIVGSDYVFHGGSIGQMYSFTNFGNGSTCGTVTTDGNLTPDITLNYTNGFSIPKNTPFELNGSASDDPTQTLTYSWENIQLGDYTPLQVQLGDSPAFRSYMPTDVTNRVFPRLPQLLNNQSSNEERLADYGRKYAFRFTVRDGHEAHPGLAWKDVSFSSTDLAGPFLVMEPNTATDNWVSGTYTEVKWDVANSDQMPVNCQRVNIRLSTDGGLTWPTTLAANVENDGVQSVLVPTQLSNTARVRVDAADNIFFDVSNANFKIVAPTQPGLTTGISSNFSFICLPDNFSASIFSAGVQGFSNPVTVEVLGQLPPGAVLNLSKTSLVPGETSNLVLDMSAVTITDTFNFIVRTYATGADTTDYPVRVITKTNDFSTLAPQSPVNGINLSQNQVLRWSKSTDAQTYDIQLATSPAFEPNTIVGLVSNTLVDTFKIPVLLAKGTAYYWRVRPNNVCSPHPWSEPAFFSTLTETCNSFVANDLPKGITANSATTVESVINIGQGGAISEISVKNITGYHDFFGDLDVRLISPQGTEVILFRNRCNSYSGPFNLGLDDNAPTSFSCPPSNAGNIIRPQSPLAAMSGQNSTGNWTLRVKDTQASSGGQLDKFELDFCAAVALNSPYIVNNLPLTVPTGTSVQIPSLNLLCEDADNTASELTYTLVTVPVAGELVLEGFGVLAVGDEFTQAQVNSGLLRFYDFGFGKEVDCFRFVVSDGTGGFLGTPAFCLQPTGVGTNDFVKGGLGLKIQPNPATDAVWVIVNQVSEQAGTIRVWSLTGQLMQELKLPQGQDKIQVSTAVLPRGIYLIEMLGAKGRATQKLVLK